LQARQPEEKIPWNAQHSRGEKQQSKHHVVALPELISRPDIPGISKICRDSFHAAAETSWLREKALAQQRNDLDAFVRKRDRERAKAWRKLVNDQQQQEAEQAAAQHEAEVKAAKAKALAEEKASKRKSVRASLQAFQKRRTLRANVRRFSSFGEEANQVDLNRRATIARRRAAAQKDRYDALPAEQRAALEMVFTLYDADKSGKLDVEEIRQALLDLGLRGINAAEQRELATHLRKACEAITQVDLVEFALDVVSVGRRLMLRLRQETLKGHLEVCGRTFESKLVLDQVIEAAKGALPLELLDEDDDSINQQRLLDRLRIACEQYISSAETGIGAFTEEVMTIGEIKLRQNSDTARKIKERHRLTEDQYARYRNELLALDAMFQSVDVDKSGYLDPEEVMELFSELGVVPLSSTDHRRVMTIIASYGQASFAIFLDLVKAIRDISEDQLDPDTEKLFEGIKEMKIGGGVSLGDGLFAEKPAAVASTNEDRDRYPLKAIQNLLQDIKVIECTDHTLEAVWKTPPDDRLVALREHMRRKGRDCLLLVLQDIDTDGSQTFPQAQVRRIIQMARERKRQRRLAHEARVARDLNFDQLELSDVRGVFRQFDTDYGGQLDRTEVQKAMSNLRVSFKRDSYFDAAFRALDEDQSGFLEFCEFIKLVRMFTENLSEYCEKCNTRFRADANFCKKCGEKRPGERIATDLAKKAPFGDTPITMLADLNPLHLRILVDVLKVCTPEESDTLDDPELLQKAANALMVGTKMLFSQKMNVNTVQELLDFAAERARYRDRRYLDNG
jgi:Ca2+-binding EF-hand superfamily protein